MESRGRRDTQSAGNYVGAQRSPNEGHLGPSGRPSAGLHHCSGAPGARDSASPSCGCRTCRETPHSSALAALCAEWAAGHSTHRRSWSRANTSLSRLQYLTYETFRAKPSSYPETAVISGGPRHLTSTDCSPEGHLEIMQRESLGRFPLGKAGVRRG